MKFILCNQGKISTQEHIWTDVSVYPWSSTFISSEKTGLRNTHQIKHIQTEWEMPVCHFYFLFPLNMFSSLNPFTLLIWSLCLLFLHSFISWKNLARIPAVIPLRFSIRVENLTHVSVVNRQREMAVRLSHNDSSLWCVSM